MKKFFPFIDWMTNYKRQDLSGDMSAGLTVGVMLIPQGMAYSMLAGLPPIYGLYASTIPLIIYALLGTSRQLAVGPVAMVALLIASGVGALAEIGSESFIELAILLALMVGLMQLAMGLFRLGFLVNFLSHPVIAGFTSAAAIIIGMSQVKHIFGIDIPRGKVHETVYNIIQNVGEINWITFAIGLGSILTIIFLKKISKKIPAPLVVVVLGIAVVAIFSLDASGVKIVQDVPAGLPPIHFSGFDFSRMGDLFPIAITIALIGFMESIAVAKAIQAKHKNYNINANQELIGLGAANIAGSFFSAFPTTGGFSRTAVNDQAGAKTGLAAIISASLVLLTLLFLTDYFYFLPKAILASIILVAVYGLIDFKEAKHLWKVDKKDFSMFMITAIATLVTGVEEGIIIGAITSIIALLIQASYPHIAELGKLEKEGIYRNIKRFPEAKVSDNTLMVRLDARMFYANLTHFGNFVKEREQKYPNLKRVVLDAQAINGMDSSALHFLHDMAEDYQKRDIEFHIVSLKGPLRDLFEKAEMEKAFPEGRIHRTMIELEK